jgi:ankyrin repeat protein
MSAFDMDLLDFNPKEREFVHSVIDGSIDAPTSLHGKTSLHLAVALGETSLSAYLIERGAPVDGLTANDTLSERVRKKRKFNLAISLAISKYL